MAINPFPVGYQPIQPGYNPYYQQAPAQQPTQQAQPTKFVEVIPVATVDEASACPMAAGSSVLFFARDDSFVAVKTSNVNGQITFDVYDKRPPAPSEPSFDPTQFVRRDELESLVAQMVASQGASKRKSKGDDAE